MSEALKFAETMPANCFTDWEQGFIHGTRRSIDPRALAGVEAKVEAYRAAHGMDFTQG